MTNPKPINLSTTLARIEAAERIMITTHARADGDAIGSVAAMQRVLRGLGRTARGMLHEAVPERYRFMTDLEPLGIWDDAARSVLAASDLLIVLDTCSTMQLDRVASVIRETKLHKLSIDHHITRDDIVDEVFADESAAAASLILVELFDAAGWPIDETIATMLYTGLATDTGWFRFSNADARAYRAASRLIESGAKPNELYERLFLCESPARARLIGAVMSGAEFLAGGRLAVVRLTRDLLKTCGATSAMTEDLINEPQRIGTVMACAMFVEPDDDGPIRISLRSKRDIDVAAIATQFGGGGHARAAGARVSGTIDEVAQRVVNVLLAELSGRK